MCYVIKKNILFYYKYIYFGTSQFTLSFFDIFSWNSKFRQNIQVYFNVI